MSKNQISWEIDELKSKLDKSESQDVTEYIKSLETKYSVLKKKLEDLKNLVIEK